MGTFLGARSARSMYVSGNGSITQHGITQLCMNSSRAPRLEVNEGTDGSCSRWKEDRDDRFKTYSS